MPPGMPLGSTRRALTLRAPGIQYRQGQYRQGQYRQGQYRHRRIRRMAEPGLTRRKFSTA